jgi:hypothetical protein
MSTSKKNLTSFLAMSISNWCLCLHNGSGRAKELVNADSAICAFFRIDAGPLFTFDDSPFGTFIDATTAVDTLFGDFVSQNSLL